MYTEADLFGADGRPHAADVRQDAVYDCYFVAPMGALAERQPDRIREAVRFDAATGDFTVRLYRQSTAEAPDHRWHSSGRWLKGPPSVTY